MRIGAHVPSEDPVAAAAERGAEVVQVFLSAPRSWRAPVPRADAEALRESGLPIYVHSPYLLNVASTNPKVRHPSRKSLQQTCDAAASIGALGVVVHGGHVPGDDPTEEGFGHWRRTLEQLETEVPVLIENTAGGKDAMARSLEQIEQLWSTIDGVEAPYGFCLDTCHLHAAGVDLVEGTRRLIELVGRIDLVHLNDSKDDFGSRRDRHENLGDGRIDAHELVEVVRLADADTVVETPGGAEAQAADVEWIRTRLQG
jgi:deoxyribonuclease IV